MATRYTSFYAIAVSRCGIYTLYRSPVHAPECSVYRQLRESLRSTTKSWDKTWRSCMPDLVASVTTIRLYSLKWRYGLLFRPPGLNMFENIFMLRLILATVFSTCCWVTRPFPRYFRPFASPILYVVQKSYFFFLSVNLGSGLMNLN